jgi:hypothetical protein
MRKPSPATVIALVALFVALGGVGVAATGGNFILGQSNTATTNTALSAPIAGGKTLQLTNNDTSNAASTALGLNVASGHAPFTVNTGIKVAGLNADKLDGIDSTGFLPKTGTAANSAKLGGQLPSYYLPATGKAADSDKLDGIDSTGFVQGRGTFLANRIVFIPGATKDLLTIPGLGYLTASCGEFDAQVHWHNDTGGNVDAWWDRANSHFDGAVVVPNDFIRVVSRFDGVLGGTLALGVGNDPNPRQTALLHVFAFQNGDGAPCGFQVEGTLWTSQ